MSDDYEIAWEFRDLDDVDEPIGSCDECSGDVYEGEVVYAYGLVLCDQCAWRYSGGIASGLVRAMDCPPANGGARS